MEETAITPLYLIRYTKSTNQDLGNSAFCIHDYKMCHISHFQINFNIVFVICVFGYTFDLN